MPNLCHLLSYLNYPSRHINLYMYILSFRFYINESAEVGQVVGFVSAMDLLDSDQNSVIHYEMGRSYLNHISITTWSLYCFLQPYYDYNTGSAILFNYFFYKAL